MPKIFTIGHSNQSKAAFATLLTNYNIELLIDVRSNPYSRFHHFKREQLEEWLRSLDIDYLHLGDQLGGHPDHDDLYVNNRVIYERVVASTEFRRGITRVVNESDQRCLVLMCAEEDPTKCHRHPLLALALLERGVQVYHLRRDGSVQNATAMTEQAQSQMPLFEPVGEDLTWRSPKRIHRRGRT